MSIDSARTTVLYSKRSYGYARVCYDLPVDGYRFAHTRALPIRRLAPRSGVWKATRLFFPRRRGLVHTFNDLVIGAQSWIVSHELELPRFLRPVSPRQLRKAYESLACGHCRRILSMSDAARRWLLRRAPEDLAGSIAAKTAVFTGGVNGPEHFGITTPTTQRTPGEPLHLVFVGNNVFRKGGVYVLDAFERLRAEGVNARLTFIGRGQARSHVVPVTDEDRAALVHRLENTQGVRWIRQAANRDVLAILADAHVGLLPTLDDSLGWSVIEMMAARLPVVASNIVALPELVEDRVTGVLIDLPRDEDRRWIGVVQRCGDLEIVEDAHKHLVASLVKAIAELDADEDLRVQMGAAGRARYEARYTPRGAASELGRIYDEVRT